jgi:hypothetical protein
MDVGSGQRCLSDGGGPRQRSLCRRWKTTGDGERRWRARAKMVAGTRRMKENERWPKMKNDSGGSCMVVDGGG